MVIQSYCGLVKFEPTAHLKENRLTHLCQMELVSNEPVHFRFKGRKNITRYKRAGYIMDIMRQSACLVVNHITVDSYGFLFICTTVGQASDLMTALT